MRRGRTLLFLVLLAAGAAGGAAYLEYYAVPEVSLARPARGPAVQAVYATGVVEPVQWAKVTPLVRGRIVELCACEGASVEKGAVLARLDDKEARAELAELEARERFLAQDATRLRQLYEQRVATPQAYERALSDHAQAVATISAARERIDRYTLRTPMAGTVLRQDGEVGEVVDAGQVLFWVGRPKPLWVVAEVDEEDIPLVRPGQGTLIKADAFPGRALEGAVAQITPKGDPLTKSYRVRIALPDDTPLLIGMTVELNVIVRTVEDALLVPSGALSGRQVFVVEEGRAVPRPIETGIKGVERVQVTAGLGEEDLVIADPPAGLRPGARVRVRTAP